MSRRLVLVFAAAPIFFIIFQPQDGRMLVVEVEIWGNRAFESPVIWSVVLH